MSSSLLYRNVLKITIAGLCGITVLLGSIATVAAAESELYSVARGGRLYDKWFKESKQAKTPEVANPNYPDAGKYKGNKAADWRCKECHGWDYLGNRGAYASGKHFTGIKGIEGMAGAEPAKIIAVLKNETHAMQQTGLTENDFHDLAMFVSKGQVILLQVPPSIQMTPESQVLPGFRRELTLICNQNPEMLNESS